MSANSSSKGKPTVTSVEFRPAKGGVVSETRTETKRGGQGGGPMCDYDSATAVHPTLESAADHLKKHMGNAFSDSDREADDKE